MACEEGSEPWLPDPVFTGLVGRADPGTGTGWEGPRLLRAVGSQTAKGFPLDLCELQVVVLVLGGARQGWVQEPRKACGKGKPRPCAGLC